MKAIERTGEAGVSNPGKRAHFSTLLKAGAGGILTAVGLGSLASKTTAGGKDQEGLSFQDGKYQTFPRWEDEGAHWLIDIGTLGPDVDTIFGIDFEGNIPTGALVIHTPVGEVTETRVVGIKRTDLETVQFQRAKGGDRFDVFRMSEHGGNEALDKMARLHAQNTARPWQKVVYVGDLGLFERQWGANEGAFLHAIIRAQRPPQAGIIETPFVNPRQF